MFAIRPIVKPLGAPVVLMALGSLALAGGLTLNYELTGPPIDGVTPTCKATLVESSIPGQLTCEVKNVNLPDGTELEISIDFSRVGTLNLMRGEAKVQTTVPIQVHTGPFAIMTTDHATIMTGQWSN